MEFDVIRTIGAVTRSVADRERDGRPARAVVASRDYDTTPDDVWDAITSPARIPRCEPPRHLALTWEFGGEVSWVTVDLTENAGRTHLELEHIAYVDDARWNQYGPGAVGVGWDMTLMGLDRHLASGAANDPQAFMAWCVSDEGKSFIHRSSDDWRRASVERPSWSRTSGSKRGCARCCTAR